MNIKAEPTTTNNMTSNTNCRYCQARENETSFKIQIKERENLKLKYQIQNLEGAIESLKHELNEKESKL